MRLLSGLLLFLYAALLASADASVFVYHRFDDTKHSTTSVSSQKLRKDFQYLKDNGYTIVPLQDIVKHLKAGETIPEKTVALTIDDGYKSFFDNGLPIFKEFGYPFTLYVYIKATEKGYGDYMSWDEIKEADKFGDIGLHSYAHPHLTYESDKAVLEDTQKAYELFTKRMGYKPKSYAYPYGEFNEQTKRLIRSKNFDFICNQNAGGVADFSDPYDIDRIAVTEDTTLRYKLRMTALEVELLEPQVQNNRLKSAMIHLADSSITSVEVYLSGYGWERVKVNNAKVSYNTDKALRFDRSRLIVKHGNRYASKIIMKRKK